MQTDLVLPNGSRPMSGVGGGSRTAGLVAQFGPDLLAANLAKKCFRAYTTEAGTLIPIFSNVAQKFLIQNPPGSGVFCALVRVLVGYVSGTTAAGHLCYAINDPNSGAPVLTSTTKIDSKWGAGGKGDSALQAYSAATVGTALVYGGSLAGQSQGVPAATNTNAPYCVEDNIRGEWGLMPGEVVGVCGNLAPVLTGSVTISWIEVPLSWIGQG